MSERTLTEFLQHSGRVLADVVAGGVVLRRRDGEDLVVTTRGQSEAVGTVLRILASAATGDPRRADAVVPWLGFLSPDDRAECLRELAEVASAAVATGRLSRLEETLDDWRATALAAWDERRLRERTDPAYADYTRDAPLPLPRPGR